MSSRTTMLVGLDVLLDFRLSALGILNHTYPEQLIGTNYKERNTDDFSVFFPDFDKEAYEKILKEDPYSVMQKSNMTAYLARLSEDVRILTEASANHPEKRGVHIDINTSPCHFTEDEKTTFKEILREYLGDGYSIGFVNIPIERLTPALIQRRWEVITLYSFDKWLTIHQKELLDNRIARVTCITPRLLLKEPDATMETEPTHEVTAALAEYIGLEWIKPKMVSSIL